MKDADIANKTNEPLVHFKKFLNEWTFLGVAVSLCIWGNLNSFFGGHYEKKSPMYRTCTVDVHDSIHADICG